MSDWNEFFDLARVSFRNVRRLNGALVLVVCYAVYHLSEDFAIIER